MNKTLCLLISLFLTGMGFAQGPPILTGTPVMLGLEGNGLRTFGKLIVKEEGLIYVQPLGVPYNISPKFQVGGILPFKYVKPGEAEAASGLADASAFAKYQIFKRDGRAKTFRILAKVQHTFPSGNTLTSPPIGAGIHQTYVGFIAGRISSAIGLYSDFGYVFTSRKAADRFLYNLAVSLPLLPQQYPQKQLNTLLELNGSYLIHPDLHTLFLSPGLQFIPGRRILFEASFQIPVLFRTRFNIIHSNQTRYVVLIGTRFLLH